MKYFNFIVIIIFMIPIVYATEIHHCQSIQKTGEICTVITPMIGSGCSTYDLYNSTYDLLIDDGTMEQIGTTGVYYFNFSQSIECEFGCDNSTQSCRSSQIEEYSIYFLVIIIILILIGVLIKLYRR